MTISKWFLSGFDGVFDKNEEMAFTYAMRAAKDGLPTAEFALGYFYEVGICIPADLRQAQTWYQKAAEHGRKDAVSRLDSISQQKTLLKEDYEQTAITRIRSQYGSQRGKRPEHSQEKHVILPPTIETKVDRPLPKRRNAISNFSNLLYPNTLGGEYPSTLPYPEYDVAASEYAHPPRTLVEISTRDPCQDTARINLNLVN